jgi:hypothetical protein
MPERAGGGLLGRGTVLVLWLVCTAAQAVDCPGDCDGNGRVDVNELIQAVNIALGARDVGACAAADADRSGTVAIDELVRAVAAVLDGCGGERATHTPPPQPTRPPSALPPIVETGRVVFRSSNGESCCIAVDPALLPPMPQQGLRVLVLDDLPIGRATVAISGYVQDFAPAPAGVTATCRTQSSIGVRPCDPTLKASAAYESDPVPVTILPGALVNLGAIELAALPFLLDFTPPQNTQALQPVDLAFTVVDARTGIAAPSVALDVTSNVAQGEPPVVRPQTRRVPLELDPCLDGSARPCSPQGNLSLSGFKARGVAEPLSPLEAGPVTARITAQNLADPSRDLDFSYLFMALPAPTRTPVATTTPIPTRTPEPTRTPIPSDTPTEVPSATRTASVTATRTRTISPTVTRTATHTATRTETAVPPTRTPTQTPLPTATTLCQVTPRSGCRTSGRSLLLIKVAADRSKLTWRWLNGNAPLAEFGDPTRVTPYGLCVYASAAAIPALTVDVGVEAAGECRRPPCWRRLGSGAFRGYRFNDPAGIQHGMTKVLLKGGRQGRDSLLAVAGGRSLALPPPFSVGRLFAQEDVIVQLVTDADSCWESTFRPRDVLLNLPELYQAAR